MNIQILGLITLAILIIVLLIFPTTEIYAGEQVKWKTFKEKNDLYTIKYPSNWVPQKMDDYEGVEITSPINMNFIYVGGGSQFATIGILAEETIFTNATDLIDSTYAVGQSFPKYKVLEPMECTKYMITQTNACSTIISFKNTELPGKPMVNELDIVAIDDDGVQYLIYYTGSKDLFDDFLPVVDEMVRSFTVTGNILSSDDESALGTDNSPELPPITESSTFQKL